MKKNITVIILVLILWLIGSVLWYTAKKDDVVINKAPPPSWVSYNTKIIAFWDSLTAGFGVELSDSYPSILQSILNQNLSSNEQIEVVNMGVSGETSSWALERVGFVIQQNPQIVLLGIGANDMLRATEPQVTKNNIATIIEKLQANNIQVILLGFQSVSSNGPKFTKDFNTLYPTLAKKYNTLLVPSFLRWVALVPELNTPDGIHPNRAWYEKIVGENILPVIQPILKERK